MDIAKEVTRYQCGGCTYIDRKDIRELVDNKIGSLIYAHPAFQHPQVRLDIHEWVILNYKAIRELLSATLDIGNDESVDILSRDFVKRG